MLPSELKLIRKVFAYYLWARYENEGEPPEPLSNKELQRLSWLLDQHTKYLQSLHEHA